MSLTKDLILRQGKTFTQIIRWETLPVVYRPISAIDQSFGAARLTVPGHGLPSGWRCALSGVKGMTEINALNRPPRDSDYTPATVINASTLELNAINVVGFRPHTPNTGFLQYHTPHDLSGYGARMAFKAKANLTPVQIKCVVGGVSGNVKPTGPGTDGAVTWAATAAESTTSEWVAGATYAADEVIDLTDLMFLSVANGRLTVDDSAKTIALSISATDTAAISWSKGVYELEMVSPGGEVTLLMAGAVAVTREVTT
jgi:hypothetical protein